MFYEVKLLKNALRNGVFLKNENVNIIYFKKLWCRINTKGKRNNECND